MANPTIPNLPTHLFFTLEPTHLAGRRALKGFEFQTAYITYVLSGFAAGKEDFVSARVEAVEDLDALVRVDETWIERYYQIKSRQESAGRWTINLLDREGVVTNFFTLFRKFRVLGLHQNRAIQLVLVVDGELDGELARLRDEGVRATDIKLKLFALLCSRDVVSRNRPFEPMATAIRDFYENNAHLLLVGDTITASKSAELQGVLARLAPGEGEPVDAIRRRLIDVAEDIAPLLDDFVASLRFDSRLGPLLSEATFARLMEAGDLSPDEARAAYDRLKRSVQEESAQALPTVIDHLVLRGWLGVPQRLPLQAKPKQDVNAVARNELLGEVSSIMRTERFVLLHGLSKIGKSQLVAALIDYEHMEGKYFWYTFLGDVGDLDRLTKQLAIWVGERTGKWQIVDDFEKAGLSPFQAFERLRQSAMSRSYIVLDDCHKATDALVFEMLHRLTCEYWSGSSLIMVSERKIPSAVASGAREIPIGGFSPQESIVFLSKLGVDLTDSTLQFLMLSVQVGGHPVMLKAAAEELPPRPSLADVLALGERTRLYLLDNHRFHARARITARVTYRRPGEKTFEVISEEGSRLIRDRVLRRAMDTEADASHEGKRDLARINLVNYDIRVLGAEIADSRRYYVLALEPKSKSPYLVKGKAWIDANEYALARLEGVVAKKPSIWAGSPVLRQTYMKSGPFWLPEKNLAVTNAPVFGNTNLAIESSGYEIRRGPAVEGVGANNGN